MTVDELLENYPQLVRDLVLKIRKLVQELMPPDTIETATNHKVINYSTPAGQMKGMIAYIAPLKDSVNLGFSDGVDLPDPERLLKGTGKRLRHIKFKSSEEFQIHIGAVRALLTAAIEMKSQG